MRGMGVGLAALLVISLFATTSEGGSLSGTVALPAGFQPQSVRYETYWRVENGTLPVAPPRVDPRTEMIVYLEGGKAPSSTRKPTVVKITDYRFHPACVGVPVGGVVQFKNAGRHARVIYDVQKVMTSGTVRPRESRSQSYKVEGEFEIREEEFPHMRAVVKVLPTTLFTRPDAKGGFKFPQVPDGRWTARLWYRGELLTSATVEVMPKGTEVVLRVPPQPPRKPKPKAQAGGAR